MNNKKLQLEGISHNLKYIFTNRGIIETAEFLTQKKTRFIEYSHESLPLAVLMMEEHSYLEYSLGKISLQEYSNSARKFLYRLVEIVKPEGQSTIIREWEKRYGDNLLLINESLDRTVIEKTIHESWTSLRFMVTEEWYNPLSWDWKGGAERAGKWIGDTAKGAWDWTKEQGKQIAQKGIYNWAGEKVTNVWNSVKDAVSKAWKCLSNNFFECLMEGLREAAFSAVGMGVMTAISFIPVVGEVSDIIIFGALLIWDVYKAFSGKYETGKYKWSFADIIIDAVCVIIPALGNGMKLAMGGIKTAEQLGVKAATEGGILAKGLNLVKGSLGKIISVIGTSAKWLGEKLGLKFLENMGTKAEAFVTKNIETAAKTAEKNGAKVGKKGVLQTVKDFKFTKPVPVVAKSVGKTILITGALCAALGLDGWSCQHKVENGEVSKEELEKAQKSLASKETSDKLNSLSDQQINQMGLF